MSYQNIIVAVDNDAANELVCERAHAVAQGLGARLHLRHVMKPLPPVASINTAGSDSLSAEASNMRCQDTLGRARIALTELASLYPDSVVSHEVVVALDTSIAIHHEAHASNADLIIAGSHGRHGLSLLFYNSTSNALLKKAPCDVLAVRINDECLM